jgi:hypothetical protein
VLVVWEQEFIFTMEMYKKKGRKLCGCWRLIPASRQRKMIMSQNYPPLRRSRANHCYSLLLFDCIFEFKLI